MVPPQSIICPRPGLHRGNTIALRTRSVCAYHDIKLVFAGTKRGPNRYSDNMALEHTLSC